MSRTKWIITTVIAATLITVPAVLFAQAQKPQAATQTTVSVSLSADAIFEKVNQERTERGLKPLIRDARLDATAQERADDMVKRDYFSHYDPITGDNLAKVLNKYYPSPCSKVSENIGMTSGHLNNNTAKVDGWMKSKPHREAILLSEYTLTGVAVSGDKVVQHFCST